MPTGSCMCHELKYEYTGDPNAKVEKLNPRSKFPLLIYIYRRHVTACPVESLAVEPTQSTC